MNREKVRIFKDERGISPVVATVILVTVTIGVALTVYYWMGGIALLYTRFEKLEISSVYATWNTTSNQTGKGPGEWEITMNLKNTGSADAYLTGLLVNGKPWDEANFGGKILVPSGSLPAFVPSGQPANITFYIAKGGGFSSGVSIEIKLQSMSGQNHPKTISACVTIVLS